MEASSEKPQRTYHQEAGPVWSEEVCLKEIKERERNRFLVLGRFGYIPGVKGKLNCYKKQDTFCPPSFLSNTFSYSDWALQEPSWANRQEYILVIAVSSLFCHSSFLWSSHPKPHCMTFDIMRARENWEHSGRDLFLFWVEKFDIRFEISQQRWHTVHQLKTYPVPTHNPTPSNHMQSKSAYFLSMYQMTSCYSSDQHPADDDITPVGLWEP